MLRYLSMKGGFDSSLTAALVVKYAKESGLQYPIHTYSIGMSDSPDLVAAKKVWCGICNIIFSDCFGIIKMPKWYSS
jgi:asparagine synthetase B (glutamine-hydrolysing)